MREDKVILPIWHNITLDEIMDYSPSLANLHALSTYDYSLQEIASRLVEIFDDDPILKKKK